MKRQPTEEEMLLRMAGMCAVAEHCTSDIRDKILKKGFSRDEADRMIKYLVDNKYIDDGRFAKAFASDKVRFSGWGRAKIRMWLKLRRISESAVGEGLACVSEEDYMLAFRKAMEAKARGLDLGEVKDRQRLYRHLSSRGFESGLIVSEMRKLVAEHGNTE